MSSKKTNIFSFLGALYCVPLFFLLLLVLLSLYQDSPISKFTRDPAATAGISPLTGVASHFGVLLLTASGAICLFSWVILKKSGVGQLSVFLLCSGLMSIFLGLDDLLMLHESVYPRLFGISEKGVFLIYALILLGGSIKFRHVILKTEYSVLLLAIGFLGLSLIVDGVQEYVDAVLGQWRIFLEDGSKFLGIVAWFGYYLRCCVTSVKRKLILVRKQDLATMLPTQSL